MDTGSAPDKGSDAVPAGVMLDAIGRELDRLGCDVDRLQDMLSPALTPVLVAHPEAMIGLQDLDRLAQTLRALSGLVRQLGIRAAEGPVPDLPSLMAAIPLADLAFRLGQRER